MELKDIELYSPIPDGYELVGFRIGFAGDSALAYPNGQIVYCSEQTSGPRMIVRKIKPRIKRSFRVDVLDERRPVGHREWAFEVDGTGREILYMRMSNFSVPCVPCIVTELPVDND